MQVGERCTSQRGLHATPDFSGTRLSAHLLDVANKDNVDVLLRCGVHQGRKTVYQVSLVPSSDCVEERQLPSCTDFKLPTRLTVHKILVIVSVEILQSILIRDGLDVLCDIVRRLFDFRSWGPDRDARGFLG